MLLMKGSINMSYLVNKNTFLKIFSNPVYRLKLDHIILDFWGFDTNRKIFTSIDILHDVILEFNVLLENNLLFRIRLKDTKNLFQSSKQFYLNFSLKYTEKSHELVIPHFWNIYCHNKKRTNNPHKLVLQFANIFQAKTLTELNLILTKLKIFNNDEINDIINMIKLQNKDVL